MSDDVRHEASTANHTPRRDQNSTPAAVPGYEIVRELGHGGGGVVYLARQVALGREVALKLLLAGEYATEEDRRRFRTEAEAIAAIGHPAVVQVFDYGTHEGHAYFAMEYCQLGSLAARLAGKPIAAGEAAAVVEQVARGVQAAHERGIVHRDLKPGNVLLSEPGASATGGATPPLPNGRSSEVIAKVADFGLAKRLDDGGNLTRTGNIFGTPSYMPPEQAQGRKDVGPPADVWALGAILYECLTGRPPFLAATTFDTLVQVMSEEPVQPRQLNAAIPRDLETICLKCLQKALAERYRSGADLANDLGRFQRGEPIEARPVGRIERAWKAVVRRPVVSTLLAVTAVALVAGTGISTYFGVQAQRHASDAKAALASVEETLAEGLLRPLGHSDWGAPNEFELESLEELASLPSDRDRVRRLVVELAFKKGLPAEQWNRRLDALTIAIVGLRSDLREEVLKMATEAAKPGGDLGDAQRFAGVRLLGALGCADPAMADFVSSMLVQAIKDGKPWEAGHFAAFVPHYYTDPLQAFAIATDKEHSRTHASTLVQLLVQLKSAEGDDRPRLTMYCRAFAIVAAAIDQREVGKPLSGWVSQTLGRAIPDASRFDAREVTSIVTALAPALPPEDARNLVMAQARQLLIRANRTGNPEDIEYLADAVATLSRHFDSSQAFDLARQVIQSPGGSPDHTYREEAKAEILQILAAKLPNPMAVRFARDIIVHSGNDFGHFVLEWHPVFAKLAPHLGKDEASKAAAHFKTQWDNYRFVDSYSKVLTYTSFAAFLDNSGRTKDAASLARALLRDINPDPSDQVVVLHRQAAAVAQLAPYLEPHQADALIERVATRLGEWSWRDPGRRRVQLDVPLATIAALAPRLTDRQATFLVSRFLPDLGPNLVWHDDHFVKNSLPAYVRLLSDADALELLKHPGVGRHRAAVLAVVAERFGRQFATVWDLAAYLKRHRPDLDPDAPLKRTSTRLGAKR